jgi:hypothetical protein
MTSSAAAGDGRTEEEDLPVAGRRALVAAEAEALVEGRVGCGADIGGSQGRRWGRHGGIELAAVNSRAD